MCSFFNSNFPPRPASVVRSAGSKASGQRASERGAFHGFSLVELLVAVTILGILAALLLAALPAIRAAAQRAGCLSNLRQIGAAGAAYSADHNMAPVPPNFWHILSTQGYLAETSPVWICPADQRMNKVVAGVGPISYAYNAQKLGLPPTSWNTASIASLTLLNNPAGVVYFSDATAYFMNKTVANQNADFRHQGNINALFFDGHVTPLVFDDKTKFYDRL